MKAGPIPLSSPRASNSYEHDELIMSFKISEGLPGFLITFKKSFFNCNVLAFSRAGITSQHCQGVKMATLTVFSHESKAVVSHGFQAHGFQAPFEGWIDTKGFSLLHHHHWAPPHLSSPILLQQDHAPPCPPTTTCVQAQQCLLQSHKGSMVSLCPGHPQLPHAKCRQVAGSPNMTHEERL